MSFLESIDLVVLCGVSLESPMSRGSISVEGEIFDSNSSRLLLIVVASFYSIAIALSFSELLFIVLAKGVDGVFSADVEF